MQLEICDNNLLDMITISIPIEQPLLPLGLHNNTAVYLTFLLDTLELPYEESGDIGSKGNLRSRDMLERFA